MANFYIQTNINVIPIEEIAFTDTTQKAKSIHSSIDRMYSATAQASLGTTAANVSGHTLTMVGYASDSLSTLLGISASKRVGVLYIKVLSPTMTQQVTVQLTSDDGAGTESANLYLGDQQNFLFLNCNLTADSIYLSNGYSSSITLEIVLGTA